MKLNEEEKLHGAALIRIVKSFEQDIPGQYFHIKSGKSRSSYTIHCHSPKFLGRGKHFSAGLFIKVSTAVVTPWSYSFAKEHQDEINMLKEEYGECFVIFIAGDDGFVCLNYDELKQILDEHHEEQEWVSISRKPKERYRVSGNDGKHEKPIPRNSFPVKVTDHFKTLS